MLATHAPAKMNLYLHVTGRREDGYHFLDSLVAFANVGDELTLEPADSLIFEMKGPMAAALSGEDPDKNLIVRAARLLGEALGKAPNVKFVLTKNLPVASGIGGGSTDAAAALRLLGRFWGLPENDPHLYICAAKLGQDVPCCLAAETCTFKGIGDEMGPGPALPHTDIVLVNPRQALPTPAVFKKREGAFQPPAPLLADIADVASLVAALATRQNGLTEAAIALCPSIDDVLTALASQKDCLLSRMSGSGATCFGIFPDRSAARQAAVQLYEAHPTWWVVPAFWPDSSAL